MSKAHSKQFLSYISLPREANRKTTTYEVRNLDKTILLGHIKWHGAWRKYCFFPQGDTIFDAICLQDIIMFIDAQMAVRKLQKNIPG